MNALNKKRPKGRSVDSLSDEYFEEITDENQAETQRLSIDFPDPNDYLLGFFVAPSANATLAMSPF